MQLFANMEGGLRVCPCPVPGLLCCYRCCPTATTIIPGDSKNNKCGVFNSPGMAMLWVQAHTLSWRPVGQVVIVEKG